MSAPATRRAAVAILATTAAAWRHVRAQPAPAQAHSTARTEPVVTHHGGRSVHLTERA